MRLVLVFFLLITVILCTDSIYVVVDTFQDVCYDDQKEVDTCPDEGSTYYGQDAQYEGTQASYVDNLDGTILDQNTGLLWQKDPTTTKKYFDDALEEADTFTLGDCPDGWRLPSVQELYTLIDFRGLEAQNAEDMIPFIDTDYFDFYYGNESTERLIDAQYWSSNEYLGTTMVNDECVFGVNFADGRIKCYPNNQYEGAKKMSFVRYVCDNPDYATNDFLDNGDDTISDSGTKLMWSKTDSGDTGMNWEEALEYAESSTHADYTDWRLPNIKELHTIVNYDRAPDSKDSAKVGPAIYTPFEISDDANYFWSSTTHNIGSGAYVAFRQAWGWIEDSDTGEWEKLNVHGAGAQRSDPKSGDPDDYPHGHGPQGDVISIYNYVRIVRDYDPSDNNDDDDNNNDNNTSSTSSSLSLNLFLCALLFCLLQFLYL
ncbi:lipoprotein [Anaeramoeba flamelloides]|uniref:Lipoprotein n=1 Tax=Anaeramoeba flamelloides TaxID=1746091 RepID=A0ABQ8YZX7_9EUKA|nr:lipoprotein [Anaeramoeba flamelloides]